MQSKKNSCCVVFGGYVNSYSIIQELYINKVENIVLVDYEKDIAYYSNKVKLKYLIEKSPDSLLQILETINQIYDYLILFPTQDIHLKHLSELSNRIVSFCYIPFNPENIDFYQNKIQQYKVCEEIGVPYPKTIFFTNEREYSLIQNLTFPVIIKPTEKDSLSIDIFRNITIDNMEELETHKSKLFLLLSQGYSFVVSEIIPGNGSNIYAYVCFRDKNGTIWGEWTGKKLSQFPNDFGVFASAKGFSNEIVIEQGRKLVHKMDLWGISEPEFKYDSRDNTYKLMEVNLRPMMWHRVGYLNGVDLHYMHYLHGIDVLEQKQKVLAYKQVHYVNLYYELINLIRRKNYFKVFKANVFYKPIDIAGFDKKDMKPFLYFMVVIFKKYFRKMKRDKL